QIYKNSWLIAHNGVRKDALSDEMSAGTKPGQVLLAGDVNVFRFDAVIAFAEAIERHNRRRGQAIEFTVMGEVAEQHRSSLSAFQAGRLLSRRSNSECLEATKAADL